ncbi:hypothetical protein [Lentibacillus salinarum]|uniref:DUF3953 domain-containing protein n=1 Tax=Lentibacillus salinarum TaxID=446820 RepID=A0ABW3ZTI4_9BACI
MKSDKLVNKPLSVFNIILISVAIICFILTFLDRQNHLIYGEIISFLAFLFFLIKGIYSIKIADYKFAIMCFIFVIVYIAVVILKVLMYSGTF